MSPSIVELNGVFKSFNGRGIIRDLSLKVAAGEAITLLGVNGAGKTTTINLILGLETPDSGKITLFNEKPGSLRARELVGVTPQNTGFPEGIRVGEIIEFVRSHYPKSEPLQQLAKRFGLNALLQQRTSLLSGGQKRCLSVALAFAGNPSCVFLDEPTTGLDVESRQRIWNAIRDYLSSGGTVFLTTHYLEEAEMLSHRIAILEEGRIKIEGSVNHIKSLAGMARIRFHADVMLTDFPYVEKIEKEGNIYTLHTHSVDNLVRALVENQIPFKHLQIVESSLENAFITMTQEKKECTHESEVVEVIRQN